MLDRELTLKSLCLLGLTLACGLAGAGKAHVHGLARLDLAVEGQRISITLTSPLDSLLGFERAPRHDAERRAVAAMQSTLRDGARVFRFDAAAHCVAAEVTLQAPVLGIGAAAKDAGAGAGEHADLQASWHFSCTAVPGSVDARLFDNFAPLRRIEVQLITALGQRKLVLLRPAQRIALGR